MESYISLPNRAGEKPAQRPTVIATPRSSAMFPGWGVRF
jgi:hypothetical protein